MHAYLIIGGNPDQRTETAKQVLAREKVGDTLVFETESKHTIASIRELNKILSISPLEAHLPRGVLLKDAHLLTEEAANAFLKTLEEPPGQVIFILTAIGEDLVLPTIKSRTQVIDLGQSRETVTLNQNFKAKSLGERLIFLDTITNRDQAKEFCKAQVLELYKDLQQAISQCDWQRMQTATALIKDIQQTLSDLEINVNVKLALGNLFLKYH